MKVNIYTNFILLTLLFASCGKEFLEVKSDVSIGTPTSISDYQSMLDYSVFINSSSSYNLSLIGSDEIFLKSETWHALPITSNRQHLKNAYIWADNLYENDFGEDWANAYKKILCANMVIDGLKKIVPEENEKENWENTNGSALFYRANSFYQLAQLFCKPYNELTVHQDLGIPLRLEADVTAKSKRASLKETYDRIILDLTKALELLPEKPLVKFRPSKIATSALLARVYLQLEDYNQAYHFSNQALQIQNGLVDYNSLDTKARYPFAPDYGQSNDEVIFFSYAAASTFLLQSRMDVDPDLMNLYHKYDLRKDVLFNIGTINNYFFRGSYYGSSPIFVGFTTAEMMLIRAESNARNGKVNEALEDINMLGHYRYQIGEFIPYQNLNEDEALKMILDERRKELAFRGLRWEDLRRLNKDPRTSKIITRKIDNQVYELRPNDLKYVWPIPDEVIKLSGIVQNPR